MPPVAAAASGIANFLAATAFTIGTVSVSWGTVLMTTTSLASSLIASSNKPRGNVADPARNIGVGVDAFMPRKCVYGRTAVSGDRIFADTYSNNQKLGQVLALSVGMISGVTGVVMNETETTLDGSGFVQTAPWTGKMRLQFKNGTDDKTAYSVLSSGSSHWTSNHRGRGVSDVFWELTFDQDAYSGGVPVPLFVGDYALVYDPRLDSTNGGSGSHRYNDCTTWEFSRSGPLQALQYLIGIFQNGKRVWGLGVPVDLIDFDSFAAAADVCEYTINSKPRFTSAGAVAADDDPQQVLEAFAASFGGAIFPSGGLIRCMAAAPVTASLTLTDDDLDGGVEFVGNPALRDAVNTVRVKFTDPQRDYRTNTTKDITDTDYVEEDNDEILDEEFPALMCDDADCAHRLGRLRLANKREPRTIRARWKAKAFRLREGLTVNVNSSRLGVSEKMMVLERSLRPDGTVELTLRTETDAKYAAMDDFTQDMPSFARVTRYDPTSVPAPVSDDWTVTAVELDGGDAQIPVIRVSGGVSDPLVRSVLVEYKKTADSDWQRFEEAVNAATVQVDITGVSPNTSYDVRVTYRNASGVLGTSPLQLDPVTSTANLVSTDATAPTAAIEAARVAINDAQGRADATLADAAGKLAEAAETGLQDSLLNWIEHPTGSDGWVADDGGFIIGKTTGFKAMWPSLASGEQTTKVLWFPHEKAVKPGVLVQAGVEVAVEGVTSEAILEAVWYDAAGSVLATEAMDNAASGRLADVVQAPASAATVRFRLVPDASTSGQGSIAVSEPFTAFARPGQTTADAFQDPASETRSRFLSIERSMGEMAGSVRQSLTENRRARAVITSTMATQVGQDSAIAAAKTEVLSTVSSTYLTQATAAETYYTEAQVNNAIATYQITVGAVTDTISAHVNLNAGAITDIEDGAAYFSVAVAAGGGNPAIYEMIAGKDGSAISLGGDALYFVNTVGGTSIKAMEVVSGDVRISNDLYVDNAIIMAAGGAIRGGASGYLTGTGFFLGYDGSAYKLAVGNPAGQYMAWDGATLAITGDFTRSFGSSGLLTMGDLGAGRTGFEILNSAGVEAFYVDDTGAMRLNGDALPTTRAGTAPSTPSPGEWWFDTSDDTEYRWNGSTWDVWGSYGARWTDNVYDRPANLVALTGSEGINNSGITIGSNGLLTGAGGGQVTISGLGYVGDLNATAGANWATNVAGRPTELTDGRITAGLDANGDLVRNITSSRATSSDLLRRTGGGLFNGDLDATLGATWGDNVISIPANLAALTGSEGIQNSAVSIGSNGALTGAGGGQVTIAGLGYTGALNATYGATWGNNVASIPSNLASLTGAESILNSGISIAANGSLSGGGGGQVTIAGLGYTGALNANYITNTNELTDGAGLGNTAAWGSVSGRPANLSSLSGGESILNSGITIGANGALTGGGGGQVTLGGLGAGTLATKSSVSDTELASGKALIQTQSGAPTPTSVRMVQDTTTGVVYADDGISARRISQDVYTNTGGNQAINATAAGIYEVVAKVALENCDENTLVGFNGSGIGYSSATANASSAAVEGQWAVIASATETAEGSTINTNVVGSSQVLAEGATDGLQYFNDGGDTLEQSSDFVSNVSPKFLDGSITGGSVYIHLGLRVSSGSGTINAGSCLLRVPRLS